MQKIILSVFAILALVVNLHAQHTEGHISYSIDFSSSQPDFQMYAGMLQGSKMDIYFTKGKSRAEMKMGTIMETTTITEESSGKILTLMSGMMGKKAIHSNQSDAANEVSKDDFKVELVNETKDIAGYKCKKALITNPEGNVYTFWYTEEVKMTTKGQKYFDGYGIPGMAMEFEIAEQGMNMKMSATLLEKKLPKKDKLFSMEVPEGYTVMTQEELMKMGQ